jgi:hypothetical protein
MFPNALCKRPRGSAFFWANGAVLVPARCAAGPPRRREHRRDCHAVAILVRNADPDALRQPECEPAPGRGMRFAIGVCGTREDASPGRPAPLGTAAAGTPTPMPLRGPRCLQHGSRRVPPPGRRAERRRLADFGIRARPRRSLRPCRGPCRRATAASGTPTATPYPSLPAASIATRSAAEATRRTARRPRHRTAAGDGVSPSFTN